MTLKICNKSIFILEIKPLSHPIIAQVTKWKIIPTKPL